MLYLFYSNFNFIFRIENQMKDLQNMLDGLLDLDEVCLKLDNLYENYDYEKVKIYHK
jgi:hypothetical protein